jgi:hypothetical protein
VTGQVHAGVKPVTQNCCYIAVNSLADMLSGRMWLYYGECFVGIPPPLPLLGGSVGFLPKRRYSRITYIKSLLLNQWACSDVAKVITPRSCVSSSAHAAASHVMDAGVWCRVTLLWIWRTVVACIVATMIAIVIGFSVCSQLDSWWD